MISITLVQHESGMLYPVEMELKPHCWVLMDRIRAWCVEQEVIAITVTYTHVPTQTPWSMMATRRLGFLHEKDAVFCLLRWVEEAAHTRPAEES